VRCAEIGIQQVRDAGEVWEMATAGREKYDVVLYLGNGFVT